MKQILTKTLSVVTIFAVISISEVVHAETIETRIGKLDFELGVPTQKTVAKLYDEMDFQRACQLYLWALPAVSFAQMGMIAEFASGAGAGDVVIFEGYRSVSAILTANSHDALHQRRAGPCQNRSHGNRRARRAHCRVSHGYVAATAH